MEGFEPSILRLGVLRPSRLGYKPNNVKSRKKHLIKKVYKLADPPGFEPGVFGLEVRRPIQLGYGPVYITIISIFFVIYIFIYIFKNFLKNKIIRGIYPLPKNFPDKLYWKLSTLVPFGLCIVTYQYEPDL